jgi:hypothetical protein
VSGDIITVTNLDGESQECYYKDIDYVCIPWENTMKTLYSKS